MNSKEILIEIEPIFRKQWSTREGRKVPDTDSLTLGNDALTIDATVLYADMADSTGLVDGFKPWFAAEIYKSYLLGVCRVIRSEGGEITAFDGDRVMAIFTGTTKNSTAARSALKINFIVQELNRLIGKDYPDSAFMLNHCIGIDTSELFVAKTGIRKSNDLVWVGRAANYAAKLTGIGEDDYTIYITEAVYKKLQDATKVSGNPAQSMWEKRTWAEMGIPIYRSNWMWTF
jgi:class 3 adenylate cyclase